MFPYYMGTLSKITSLAEKGLNICIVGEFGIGKTYLLKALSRRFKTPIFDANPSKDALEKFLGKKCKSKKEAYKILRRKRRKFLLFDDIHSSRKDTINNIIKLCKKHTIITASETEIERLNYDFEAIKLKKWDFDKCLKLCTKLKVKPNIATKIAEKSKGLPLLVVRGVEHYKITGNVKSYFNVNWKKLLIKRVVSVAYLCLSLRYFARNAHNWELYSTLSTVAYMLLAFNRYNKKI